MCFPLFLYSLRKSQGSPVLMYVKYPPPELQQDSCALPQQPVLLHFDASPLVSQEKRQREYLPAILSRALSSFFQLSCQHFSLFQLPLTLHVCLCPFSCCLQVWASFRSEGEQQRRCCAYLGKGLFLLPMRSGEAVPWHKVKGERMG